MNCDRALTVASALRAYSVLTQVKHSFDVVVFQLEYHPQINFEIFYLALLKINCLGTPA